MDEIEEDDMAGDVPYNVSAAQRMYQSFKRTILKKPVIDSLDDLNEEDRDFTYISLCYGDWPRKNNGCQFHFNKKTNRVCPKGGKDVNSYTLLLSNTKLDILMKNEVVKRHFEENGFATEWKPEGLILHPMILGSEYTGEIGEEAFKALVLEYTSIKEDDFVHLTGKEYELADFVIKNPDGTNRIAFDVKNMRSEASKKLDNPNDIPTAEKRAEKERRLGCKVITVNMLPLSTPTIDELQEIPGMIDHNGNIILDSIKSIKNYIDCNEHGN